MSGRTSPPKWLKTSFNFISHSCKSWHKSGMELHDIRDCLPIVPFYTVPSLLGVNHILIEQDGSIHITGSRMERGMKQKVEGTFNALLSMIIRFFHVNHHM